MALIGKDGETHSHLTQEQREEGRGIFPMERRVQLPDRGTWVGPRPGETHIERANAAKEWGDRMEREIRERRDLEHERLLRSHEPPRRDDKADTPVPGPIPEARRGLPLEHPEWTLPRQPIYKTETLEQRVDRLEKVVIKLQSVVIEMQHHTLPLRRRGYDV